MESASQPATAPAPSQATPAQPIAWSLQGNFAAILERLRLSLVLSTRPNHIIFLGAVGLVLLIAGIVLWVRQKRDMRPVIYGLAVALLPSLMVAIVVYIRPKLAGR